MYRGEKERRVGCAYDHPGGKRWRGVPNATLREHLGKNPRSMARLTKTEEGRGRTSDVGIPATRCNDWKCISRYGDSGGKVAKRFPSEEKQ